MCVAWECDGNVKVPIMRYPLCFIRVAWKCDVRVFAPIRGPFDFALRAPLKVTSGENPLLFCATG
jgi:hypothetical protein